MLNKLWRQKHKLSQFLKAKDKDVTVSLLPNGNCLAIAADACLQRAAITNAENKIAYSAYKGFLSLGRGAIFISPSNLLDAPENLLEIEPGILHIDYYNQQQIISSHANAPIPIQLIGELLIDKVESYNPATEAVIVFFFSSVVVLIQFKEFQVKPKECYQQLASLEAGFSLNDI